MRGDLQEGHDYASWCQFPLFLCRSPFFPSTKSAFLCSSYRRVGLEVVNVGLGKRKARRFWVCALLLICLAARSAVLPGVPFYSECLPTTCWPGNEEPGHEGPGNEEPGNESLGTKGRETKSRGTKSRRVYRRQRLRKCWCIVVSWLSSGWKAVTSWLPCCAATIFPSTVASTFTPSPTSLM